MSTKGIVSNFEDVDLIPSNVKDTIDIFGVTGNFTGGDGNLGYGNGFTFGTYGLYETQSATYGAMGVYNTVNNIYFFGGVVVDGKNFGKIIVGKYNKSTENITTYTSNVVRYTVSISGMKLIQNGGIVYYTDSTNAQSISFNTGTDTFNYGAVHSGDAMAIMNVVTTSTSGLLSLNSGPVDETTTNDAVVASVTGADITDAIYNDGINNYKTQLSYSGTGATKGLLRFKAYKY